MAIIRRTPCACTRACRGTVIAVILLDPLLVLGSDSRLAALLNKGYDYKLMLPPAGGLVGSAAAAAAGNDSLQTFASSTAEFTAEPVRVTVDMPDGQVRRQGGSVVLRGGGQNMAW